MKQLSPRMPRAWSRLAIAAVLAVAAGACEGENLFQDPVSSLGVGDRRDPSVTIDAPFPGQRLAVGDSVLVRVHVGDDRGIARVEFSGFALQGSEALGTRASVPRFESKVVDLAGLSRAVRDTVLTRYLIATADAAAEDSVFVVASVTDFAGNEVSDRVRIGLGGPRAHIVSPLHEAEIRAGTDVRVRITATDSVHRIQSLRLSASEALTATLLLTFDPPRVGVDTVVTLQVPADLTAGQVRLRLTARNTVNDSTTSPTVMLRLLPASQDDRAPTVRFSVAAPTRAEQADSIAVTVVATDETRLDRIGVTLLPTRRVGAATQTLTVLSPEAAQDSATFRVSLADLGVPVTNDTSTVRLEVTAFAFDAAGNCATATVPNTLLTEGCPNLDPVGGVRAGARFDILVVRGHTIRLAAIGDRIADMTADRDHLYLSNISRNQLEVVRIGEIDITRSIAVGSRPWGLAFNAADSRLYVANSGGTNISVVSPVTMREEERIQTPNVKLFDVPFEAKRIQDPASTNPQDSITAYFPTSVTRYDYSDRPQFIGVTQNENLVFSTLPTAAASDGTLRILRKDQNRLEIVTEYAEERVGNRVVIANADSAFLVAGSPDNLLRVCPRNRSTQPALDRGLPVQCYTGSLDAVEETINVLGYDTNFLYSVAIAEVGLSDTTFVAVSGDHSTVAFGEGARQNARVMAFMDPPGQTDGPLVRFGEIRDLVGNTAERVVGLALNADGSLGVARGNEAYFFSRDLRLQGVVETDALGGGTDMHPDNPIVGRAFVSGVQPNGLAFIDVMDTLHFRRVARIFLRDPITGPVRAVRTPSGGFKIYAVTQGGIAAIDVLAKDL